MSSRQESNKQEGKRTLTRKWTEEEVNTLIQLWGENKSNAEIAKVLDRQESAVAVKASRISLPRKSGLESRMQEKKNPKAKTRLCHTCRNTFYSEGPHNRMCDKCRQLSQDPYYY